MTKKDISMKYYMAMLCLASCSNHSAHWPALLQVESFIEQHPDSAFTVLQRIDAAELAGDEERAKHALLLSMAMDKNLIDRTDFEVPLKKVHKICSSSSYTLSLQSVNCNSDHTDKRTLIDHGQGSYN